MVQAKKIIQKSTFIGEPKLTDFQLVQEELPALKNGEILIEAIYWSVDPYMRPYMSRFPVGSTMIGGQVGKIVESKNPKFPVGLTVFSQSGWRTHTILNPDGISVNRFTVLPDFGKASQSLAVGACGMPGNTAYFGFLEICQPKEGETVVVSGAAGAVGSLVGQIAKIKGCKVIGIAGSDDKCKWLENELGFDKAINYKTANLPKALKEAAPNGYDCYFDNVGGTISFDVIQQMRTFGRISVCGAISGYNDQQIEVPAIQRFFIWNQLKMEGFIVDRWTDRWMEGIKQMLEWINSGKIKVQETVTEGFEKMPEAFIDMLNGKNTGKAIIKKV